MLAPPLYTVQQFEYLSIPNLIKAIVHLVKPIAHLVRALILCLIHQQSAHGNEIFNLDEIKGICLR